MIVKIAVPIILTIKVMASRTKAAYISAWRDLPSLRQPDRFESWLHRTLTRACYEEARRTRRVKASIRSLPTDTAFAPDESRDELHDAAPKVAGQHDGEVGSAQPASDVAKGKGLSPGAELVPGLHQRLHGLSEITARVL